MSLVVSELLPPLAESKDKANRQHFVIQSDGETLYEKMVELGRTLHEEIRPQVERGKWEAWCKENLKFSLNTAKRYIDAYKYFRESATVADSHSDEDVVLTITQAVSRQRESSREDKARKIELAVELMLDGAGTIEAAKASGLSTKTVTKLKKERVQPKLRERDWVAELDASTFKCREMAAASIWYVITQHRMASGKSYKDWKEYAADVDGSMTINHLTHAVRVTDYGCDELKEAARNGEIGLAAAAVISKLDKNVQVIEVAKAVHNDFLSDMNHLVRRGYDIWQEFKKNNPAYIARIGELSLTAKERDELACTVERIGKGYLSLVGPLKEVELCHSQLTHEPKTFSNGKESDTPTKKESSSLTLTPSGPQQTSDDLSQSTRMQPQNTA